MITHGMSGFSRYVATINAQGWVKYVASEFEKQQRRQIKDEGIRTYYNLNIYFIFFLLKAN